MGEKVDSLFKINKLEKKHDFHRLRFRSLGNSLGGIIEIRNNLSILFYFYFIFY